MKKQTFKRLAILLLAVLSFGFCMGLAVKADEVQPQRREFNALFDRMLDGVKGAEGAQKAYREVVFEAGKCDSVADPIIKVGSPKISAGFEKLLLEVRSIDSSITLNDLKIGLRTTDSDSVAEEKSYVLGGEDMIAGVELSGGADITSEWQTLTIDFAQTETGIVSTNADAMLAFHLYAKDNTVAGKLDVRKVSVLTGVNETVVVDFDSVNESWWYGTEAGCYTDHPQSYVVTTSKQIKSNEATQNNLDDKYDALVLGISGTGTVSIKLILEDDTLSAAQSWANLQDLAGTPVGPLPTVDTNVVIDLAAMGETAIKGVEVLVSDGEVAITKAFFTNLESVVPDKEFPVLDMENAAYLSEFNFEYKDAGANYDKAVEDAAKFNLDYILSYSNKNNVIENGHLVLSAKGEDFTSIKIRSKVASEGRQYIVFKYKLVDRKALDSFRFDVLKTNGDTGVGVKWSHEFLVGTALSSLSDANPYKDGDYQYLVVDMEKTFGVTKVSGVDLYIGGEGEMHIDEIFFADKKEEVEYTEALAEDFVKSHSFAAAENGYQYIGWVNGAPHKGAKYMEFTFEGDVSLLRFEMAGGVYWVSENAQGTLKDNGGELLPSSGSHTVLVDLEKSGINSSLLGDIHIHYGWTEACELKLTSVRFGKVKSLFEVVATEALPGDFASRNTVYNEDNVAAGYNYSGYVGAAAHKGSTLMEIEVEGDLSELRVEMAGGTYWFNPNPQGTFVLASGEAIPANAEAGTKLLIDLVASGIDPTNLGDMHFHNTAHNIGQVLKITSLKFHREDVESAIKWGEKLDKVIHLTSGAAGYEYMGSLDGTSYTQPKYIKMDVTGNFTEIRLELAGKVVWFNENVSGTFKGLYGANLALNYETATTIIIDLEASGIDTTKIGEIHIHNTWAGADEVLKIENIYFGSVLPYEQAPRHDDTKPSLVVVGDLPVGKMAGEEVDLSHLTFEVSDNYSLEEAINVEVKVMFGETEVTLTEGKFTPANAGAYNVLFTATDEAGNKVEVTKTLTVQEVAEPPVEDTTAPVITVNVPETAKVGSEVEVKASATDAVDGQVAVTIKVTLGEEEIAHTDGKFTPSKVGTYKVEVSATDEAGNTQVEVREIVVEKKGCKSSIGLIGASIMALVSTVTGLGVLVIKRKEK